MTLMNRCMVLAGQCETNIMSVCGSGGHRTLIYSLLFSHTPRPSRGNPAKHRQHACVCCSLPRSQRPVDRCAAVALMVEDGSVRATGVSTRPQHIEMGAAREERCCRRG